MFTQLRLARSLYVAGAILTFSGGAIGLTAAPAFAHTPSVTPSCTGLAVSFAEYEVGDGANNRVTTTIDGVPTVADFGASYSHTFTWSQTAAHTWSVVLDTNRMIGDPTAYDVTFSGTWQACQTAPTTTTTSTEPTTTTTTVAPTTTTTTLVISEAPTTTLVLSEAPTATSTTTTLVASQAPVPPTPVDPTDRQLPATGHESGRIAILGLAMFGLGLTLMGLATRSRPVSS